MNPQQLYLDDPDTLEFEAMVLEVRALPEGRTGVVLDQTYYYPTGGGQEHDAGALGPARVVDVFKDEAAGVSVHVIEGQAPEGRVLAAINGERRQRHMQHHTAQHLLTQCFIQLYDLETLSANINGYSPSTLDLPESDLGAEELRQVEKLAGQVIYQNRTVKSYFVTPEQIAELPLRKAPAVSEDIRIVEIDGYDYSACGGTHCARTGQIGMLKVLKIERIKGRTRVHFIAGVQALDYFQDYQEIVTRLAADMSVGSNELPAAVARLAEQLKAAQKELATLREYKLAFEAQELASNGTALHGLQLVLAAFEKRPVNELRALAGDLKARPGIMAFLASRDGRKVSLVVTCSADSGLSARELLNRQLEALGGRGGGDDQLAQGGGAATDEQWEAFFDGTQAMVMGMLV